MHLYGISDKPGGTGYSNRTGISTFSSGRTNQSTSGEIKIPGTHGLRKGMSKDGVE